MKRKTNWMVLACATLTLGTNQMALADEFVPNEYVLGSDQKVVTGLRYRIKNLDAPSVSPYLELVANRTGEKVYPPIFHKYVYDEFVGDQLWSFEPVSEDHPRYRIKSDNTGRTDKHYLHRGLFNTVQTARKRQDEAQYWEINPHGKNAFKISTRNKDGTKLVLNHPSLLSSPEQSRVRTRQRTDALPFVLPEGSLKINERGWALIPDKAAVTAEVVHIDVGDTADILARSPKQIELLSRRTIRNVSEVPMKQTVVFDDTIESVKTYSLTTFRKTTTSGGGKIDLKFLSVGGEASKTSFSGNRETYQSRKKKRVQHSNTVTVPKNTCLEISLLLERVQNAQVPFTARAKVTGQAPRSLKNGGVKVGPLDSPAIESILKSNGQRYKVLKNEGRVAWIEIEGIMTADLGLRTFYEQKEIPCNAEEMASLTKR